MPGENPQNTHGVQASELNDGEEAGLARLRQALVEGEKSGIDQTFDFDTFIASQLLAARP